MELDLSDFAKRRAWVLQYESDEALGRKLRAKADILKSIVWQDAIDDWFNTLFSQLIGLAPNNIAPYLARLSSEKNSPQVQKTMLAVIKAQNVLLYLCREGKYSPKIMFYCPLYSVPSPKVHLFDLSEPELRDVLQKAEKKVGANVRLNAIGNAAFADNGDVKLSKAVPQADPKQHPLYDKLMAQIAPLMQSLENALGKEMAELIKSQLTPEVILQLMTGAGQTTQTVNKQVPFTPKYEAETRKSLYHIAPEATIKGYASDAEYRKANDQVTPVYTNSAKSELEYYRAHYPKEQKDKKATPEDAFSLYSGYFDYSVKIKELRERVRNEDSAYSEFSKTANDLPKSSFFLIYGSKNNEEVANYLMAESLGVTASTGEVLRKTGSKLHQVNEKWKVFYASLSGRMQLPT